ncbi:uncharacterized protein Z520_00802 [Fonsecaea multimorphosa CBS 102226]|uniref:Reductase n=1 Tax=Fonsecaea multimorphosa CBS 102226 TaxID=1442371 RepID=A0A0D2KKU1_9EURO|nr:uncharacterized protein Z520_00802 [Fonsecaea multimorphosa CBS 102226]KIY04110.1 hypothetical protein Z520_00802 [Fonsecaea multimorphosa CBS 102226]OAL31942.1 hypothetical protein AYO22_00812 [Fonsecaea multimorphosa]
MASPPMKSFVSFTETWHNKPYPAILPSRPEISAAGKSVVITGGGTGIGKAAAIAFAQAGAKSVSIIGRRADRLQTAGAAIAEANSSTHVILQTGDVSNRTSIKAALDAIAAKTGGKIDIFLNNAGILPKEAAVIDYPESEVRRCFETNLMGSFNALQSFTPLAAPGAKLLNIGSAISHWSPLPEVPGVWSYAAAKAAALKMVEYYASENPNIHVVSIHPGIVGTEINPNIPVGPDTVELPAHFLVWIASDEAAFLRNKFVWANWDVEELKARAEEIQTSSLLRVSLNGIDM